MMVSRREADEDDPGRTPRGSPHGGGGGECRWARNGPKDEEGARRDDDLAAAPLREFLARMPKVELHAHLSGCVRESTLLELARERGVALCPRLFPPPPPAPPAEPSGTESSTTTTTAAAPRDSDHPAFYRRRPRSLQDCFDVFAEIPKVVDDLASLRRIALEALGDFAREGAVYVELRTTPKVLRKARRPAGEGTAASPNYATKREYLETVIGAVREFEQAQAGGSPQPPGTSSRRLRARVIVALDRDRPLEEARESVELAVRMKREDPVSREYVVGIDVGGNPAKGDLRSFFPLLRRARDEAGLFVTVHCAEIPCRGGGEGEDEEECDGEFNGGIGKVVGSTDPERVAMAEAEAILLHSEFVPDRLGHALLLPPALQIQLLRAKIPVETCPTSNIMTLELASPAAAVSDHPGGVAVGRSEGLAEAMSRHPQLGHWLRHDHPIAICTDDPGVFATNLTREWELVVAGCLEPDSGADEDGDGRSGPGACSRLAMENSLRRVSELMVRSVGYAFCGASLKQELRESIQAEMDRLIAEALKTRE